MNLEWTKEQLAARKRIEALLAPLTSEIESLEAGDDDSISATTRQVLGSLAESGYLELGLGPDPRQDSMLLLATQEVLAAHSGSLFLAVEASSRGFGGLLARHATPTLLEGVLEPLQRGELVGAVAVHEPPGDGTGLELGDGAQLSCRAEETSGGFRLFGTKHHITNAPLADWFAVALSVGDKPAFAIVPRHSEGLTVHERTATLGYDGLLVAGLSLDDAEIPAENILGPFDDEQPLQMVRQVQDMALIQVSVGWLERLLAAATKHAKQHRRAGRPIIKYQEVGFRLADLRTMLQSSRWLSRRAVWLWSTGDPEGNSLIDCAKVFTAECAQKGASIALQILAAQGFVKGNEVERAYRAAGYAPLAGSTSERCRMSIAADLLKRFAV